MVYAADVLDVRGWCTGHVTQTACGHSDQLMGVKHHDVVGVQNSLFAGSLKPPVVSRCYDPLLKGIPRRFTETSLVAAHFPRSWNFIDLVC